MSENDRKSPFFRQSWSTIRAYAGPPLPKQSIAIIKANIFSWQYTAYLQSIDGKPLESGYKAELLPGKHTVVIGAMFTHPYGGKEIFETVMFDAKAGREYIVRASADNKEKDMFLWLEDKKTKELVAGNKPERR